MRRTIKQLAGRWFTEPMRGTIDYYRFPERRSSWAGPFNGQSNRIQIFRAIVGSIQPVAIVETGTYFGTTTEFMAETGLPVYTIEENPRNYGFARARLRRNSKVKILNNDSRAGLKRLLAEPLRNLGGAPLFFYLDAHWDEDLPLKEEIDIIFGSSPHAVVMIDDFEVPDDPGFGYDDYGPGKTLNAEYLAPLAKAHSLAIFYPRASSQQETGLRRGCAVLCKTTAAFGGKLEAIPLLRRASL